MPFLGMTKWPPIRGWLFMIVTAHTKFHRIAIKQNVWVQGRLCPEQFPLD